MKPLDTAIFWVEYVTKFRNVLQSPGIKLNWWQRNLVDIYVFIFTVISIVFYIALFILRKLMKLLFGSRTCAKKDNAAMKLKKNK